MALKSLVLFSLLVLVLLVLVEAQNSWLKFKKEHVDPGKGPYDRNYCHREMKRRNITKEWLNTFIHETVRKIKSVCLEPNITCKNGWGNCHKSRSPMSITDCVMKNGTSDYNTINKKKHIVIACKWNPPLPVHYECSETVSSEAR